MNDGLIELNKIYSSWLCLEKSENLIDELISEQS